MNLQRLCEIMRNSCEFSIALEMATNMTVGYQDVRVRLSWNERLQNFYLLEIPMYDRDTGVDIFNYLTKALGELSP